MPSGCLNIVMAGTRCMLRSAFARFVEQSGLMKAHEHIARVVAVASERSANYKPSSCWTVACSIFVFSAPASCIRSRHLSCQLTAGLENWLRIKLKPERGNSCSVWLCGAPVPDFLRATAHPSLRRPLSRRRPRAPPRPPDRRRHQRRQRQRPASGAAWQQKSG